MKRWLPAPMLSAALWITWLLLNNTLVAAEGRLAARSAVVSHR